MPRRKLKLVKSSAGHGFLYMAAPSSFDSLVSDGGGLAGIDNSMGASKSGGTSFSVPELEVDFYSLDCATLASKISSIQSTMNGAKLLKGAYDYYIDKLAQANAAYSAKCGNTVKPTVKPWQQPLLDGTFPPQVDPPEAPVKPPITVLPNPTVPGTTVNIGDVSALNPTGVGSTSAGGGGGGGGGSSSKPADAKTNWLLWALCIGALALSLYKGRNTVTKMPG